MEIKSLKNLIKDGKVYDLYTNVLIDKQTYGVYRFECTNRHSMRMDLICFDIYENTNHIDILCNLNGIMNPLTVNSGDVILFVATEDLDVVRDNSSTFSNFLETIKNANNGKDYKVDKNRQKEVSNRNNTEKDKTYIPPNILQTSNGNMDVKDGKIILKPNF